MHSPDSSTAAVIPTIVITGPVGVGKTTIAFAISDHLDAAQQPHALVDLDYLRICCPRPEDDPFHTALGLRNLHAVWANHYAAGARRLILVDVVESREQVAQYELAIPGAAVQIVRLQADLATLHQRLERREFGASLIWHQQRAAELIALMDDRRVEDLLVDTDGKSVDEIAEEILNRLAWPH